MTDSPCDLTLAEAGRALRSGRLTSEALTRAHVDRIEAQDGRIGAFVHVAAEEALAAARVADTRMQAGTDLGPLHGIPFAVKDVIDVAGWPVRWGSRLQATRRARETAPAVQRLIDGGAVPLGLVASYEMATVGPDAESLYPQPKNPWNRDHVTGGSSSGSAAAVAAGLVRLSLGTDTGGSVRSPASYCGVVGLKPTAGAVPRDGVMELSGTMDHVGVVARTAADAAAAAAVLSGQVAGSERAVAGLRLAYGRGWAEDEAAHADLMPLLDAAASVLSLCGATVQIRALPDYAGIETVGSDILLSEGFAAHGADVAAADAEAVGPMARASILSGGEIGVARLKAARARVETLRTQIEALLADHDALILPTTLTPAPAFSAFRAGVPVWTPMRTIPFNLTGHPALSVPMGYADGLPMGLQIVGRHGDDATVLAIGAAFEAATDHSVLQPAFA
ncbi:amidase [Psychromarinibacter sp. C21-152]|uniref:Amidase n=1 Tax=Psychromarinibacter sediminicola TaxID=3033385 RepID=A0AAE3NMS6_9RHOB|nr:amidase [Psychromarinibacter sediminicola]MDF0599121.1 amidase [Psychromarinibacter sediminicola]